MNEAEWLMHAHATNPGPYKDFERDPMFPVIKSLYDQVASSVGPMSSVGYTLTDTVSADFGPVSATFFTPQNAAYMFYIYLRIITAAGGGTYTVNIVNTSGTLLTANINLTPAGLTGGGSSAFFPLATADGDISIERLAVGHSGGSAVLDISVRGYLMA